VNIPAEWVHWLDENVSRGCTKDSLIDTMQKNNFSPQTATLAVENAMARYQSKREAQEKLVLQDVVAPSPWKIVAQLDQPHIIVYDYVLSRSECDALIELSMPKLIPSTVVDNESGDSQLHPHRTSMGTYFNKHETAFITELDNRLANLMQCTLEQQEPMQILNYKTGGEYKPHYDFFPEEESGGRVHLARGGQRTATLIMYLNDVEAGGETIFPNVGFKVHPKKGSAVYFSYLQTGTVDRQTLHGGSPVLSGEKWIATKWIREGTYI
jgi:prolyl 4-hydroxylase